MSPLLTYQAVNKGKLVDSALHSVVHHIEWALSFEEYTLATFLNIEGSFNNTEIDAVMAALSRVNVKPFNAATSP